MTADLPARLTRARLRRARAALAAMHWAIQCLNTRLDARSAQALLSKAENT